jgi:hypothetical protein
MMVEYLWRRKLLFKAKTQLANSSSSHKGDKQHNTKVDGWMHNREANIVDMVEEHL